MASANPLLASQARGGFHLEEWHALVIVHAMRTSDPIVDPHSASRPDQDVCWWRVNIMSDLATHLTQGMGSLFLPGASTTMKIRCSVGFDSTTPLRIEVGIEGVVLGEGPYGLFAREPEG
jgi:hypothetical protein